MHYLKKLKNKLHYSVLWFVLILIFLIRLFYTHSAYIGNETSITGKILSYQINGDQLKIELKAKEKILVNYYFKTEEEKQNFYHIYQIGDHILVKGILKFPMQNRNFHLFHYQKYLKSKKINWVMNSDQIQLKSKNKNILYQWKNQFYQLLAKQKNAQYFYYLLLGDSNNMDDAFLQKVQMLGISHLFAISGMHIHLLASILTWILSKIVKNRKVEWIFLTIFLGFYMFLTNFSPSIIRASIFFLILLLKKIYHLHWEPLMILIGIALGMLIYNPFYVYHLGFVFSFTISFSLLYLSRFQTKQSYIKQLWQTSWISFWMGVPILIHSFFTINFLAPIWNILFVPFVSILLFPICFFSVWIPWLRPIFTFFQIILETMIDITNHITFFIVPFSDYPSILLPIILLWILYTLKCWLLKKRKPFLCLILFLVFYYFIAFFNCHFTVTMLDVGQGDSTLVMFPNQRGNILIDTGGILNYEHETWKKRNNMTLAESTLIPYMKSVGIHHLDYLILTHGDYDHMGAAIDLVNHFKVKKVILNCGERNELEEELLKVLKNKQIPYYSCLSELNIDHHKLYFLNTKIYGNENDNSSVIYMKFNQYQFLLMGDAGIDKENDIINTYRLSNIDVLKIGHHGSKTSSSNQFINWIHPNYSVISVGENNRYGHPDLEVLENLKNSNIYRTDQNGSIMFQIKNNQFSIKTCIKNDETKIGYDLKSQ